jgi:multimeric flavodoxin WrbA
MKVVSFLGSPKKNGNTARLLEEFLKGVSEKKGIIINKVYLQENKISGCTGCGYCLTSASCKIEDDMQNIYPIIKEADVLVFAMPIYWWSMPSQLKALIDRFRAVKSEIRNKKIYLLMTYGSALPNSGVELVERTFRDIFKYLEGKFVKAYGACTDEYMPVEKNTKALKEIYEIGRNI